MHKPLPPLNALRAFEAAARHMSMAKAADELHVTAGALSHQTRALEELLGAALFERRVRSIALTRAGSQLYPGLRTGFVHIRDAVDSLDAAQDDHVLVVSTLPGFTAKWLAPRLYRFSAAFPQIDVRISSSIAKANFTTDGVDAAIRNLPVGAAPDSELVIEKLIDISYVPVCVKRLIEVHGPFRSPRSLADLPLIHDDSLATRTGTDGWVNWFALAGVFDIDVSRGSRFSSADHALDATVEGAGVLLAHDVLAYDDLRTGRLVMPFDLKLASGRAYHFVTTKRRQDHINVQSFRSWLRSEAGAMDWARGR